MYSLDIIKSALIVYKNLTELNIKGLRKKQFISSTFNIHINTFYNWLKLYTNNFNYYNSKKKYNNRKVTKDIEKFVIQSMDNNNNFNINKIKSDIIKKFNITLSKKTIYFILHNNNLTYKRLKVKVVPKNIKETKKQKNKLKHKINSLKQDNIISIDEMAVYLNERPYYGWSPKGVECIVNTSTKNIINKRYTVCMAVSNKKVIDYSIVDKSLKTQGFNDFITNIVKKEGKNKTLFVDNATIHKSKLVKTTVKNNKIKMLYNVPYQSQNNPIEYVFSMLRKDIQNNDNKTLENITTIINNFNKNISPTHLQNIFNKAVKEINSI